MKREDGLHFLCGTIYQQSINPTHSSLLPNDQTLKIFYSPPSSALLPGLVISILLFMLAPSSHNIPCHTSPPSHQGHTGNTQPHVTFRAFWVARG